MAHVGQSCGRQNAIAIEKLTGGGGGRLVEDHFRGSLCQPRGH
jgi:hypothetical protein